MGDAPADSISSQQLRDLVEAHAAALVLYARQWCPHPDDAVQEALVDLVGTRPQPDKCVAWLFKTVRRKAMNQLRTESRRAKHETAAMIGRTAWFVTDSSLPLELDDLQTALTQLPDLEREVVVAHLWGKLTFEQIGLLVEVSSSAAHRAYRRALTRLSAKLDPTFEKHS